MATPRILLRVPTAEEDDRAKAFTVHKNYLSNIASYLFDSYGPPDECLGGVLAAQRALPGYVKIQARLPPDPDDISRLLMISFASELQLQLSGGSNPSSVRYANIWAPVHGYYAVYMALQAWFAMNGMSALVEDHTATLKTISTQLASRRLFPAPWCVCAEGCPQLGPATFKNAPPNVVMDTPVEVLRRPDSETFWPRYAKMLSTTRRKRLDRNFKEWKKSQHRKKMRSQEKEALARTLPATTIFDFFWRIRVRANYRDVSSFLTWNVSDLEHQEYFDSLVAVVDATVTLVQSLTARAGAKPLYSRLAREFVKEHRVNTGHAIEFLDRRISLIAPNAR